MLLFFLIIIGAALDGAITFWAIGRFGISIEWNEIVIALYKKVGRIAAFLPLLWAVPFALFSKFFFMDGDGVLIGVVIVVWLPVFWNVIVLFIMRRRS